MLTTVLAMLLIPLLAAIACCAAAETALFSITPGEVQSIAERHPGAAARLAWLRDRPRALLVTLLLVINLLSVAFFVISTVVSSRLGSAWLMLGFEVGMLFVAILGGDLLPKLIARRRRITLAPLIAWGLVPVYRVVSPVRSFLEHGVVVPLVRLIHPAGTRKPAPVSSEELGELLESSTQEANLMDHEQWLLGAVVDLGGLRVREVMTPRVDIEWVDADASSEDVLARLGERGSGLIPVARGTPDHGVVGVLNVAQYLGVVARSQAELGAGPSSLGSFLEPAFYVPDRARVDRAIEQMAARGVRLAFCVDEFGTLTGVVTSEQVLAPLLATPMDLPTHTAEVRRLGISAWSVPGRLPVRQLAEYVLGPELAGAGRASGVTTVAGLVIAGLGRIPRVGESLRLGRVRLRVSELEGRSIERVEVTLLEDEAGDGSASARALAANSPGASP